MIAPTHRVILVEANKMPGSFPASITWKSLEENKAEAYRSLVSISVADFVQQENKPKQNLFNKEWDYASITELQFTVRIRARKVFMKRRSL